MVARRFLEHSSFAKMSDLTTQALTLLSDMQNAHPPCWTRSRITNCKDFYCYRGIYMDIFDSSTMRSKCLICKQAGKQLADPKPNAVLSHYGSNYGNMRSVVVDCLHQERVLTMSTIDAWGGTLCTNSVYSYFTYTREARGTASTCSFDVSVVLGHKVTNRQLTALDILTAVVCDDLCGNSRTVLECRVIINPKYFNSFRLQLEVTIVEGAEFTLDCDYVLDSLGCAIHRIMYNNPDYKCLILDMKECTNNDITLVPSATKRYNKCEHRIPKVVADLTNNVANPPDAATRHHLYNTVIYPMMANSYLPTVSEAAEEQSAPDCGNSELTNAAEWIDSGRMVRSVPVQLSYPITFV